MKARHLKALADLGIVKTRYAEGVESGRFPPVWGIELKHERRLESLYVEHTGSHNGGDNRYHLRTRRYDPSSELAHFPRQQDAVAGAIRHWYGP